MSSIAQELHEAGVTPLPLVVVVQTLADDQRELARQHYENWIPCAPKANLLQAGIRLETVRPGSLQDWLQIIDDVFCRFKDYDPTSIRDIHENLPDEAVEIS